MNWWRSWLALVLLVTVWTLAFERMEVPSAPLFGGMVGGLIHTLILRGTARLPSFTFTLAQGAVGVTVGAMVEWERLKDLGSAWPAVLLVCFATLGVSVAIGQILRLHRGVSVATATFSSIAGGASGMTAMSGEFGADDRIVAVVQYLRIVIIFATLPVIVSWAYQGNPVSVTTTSDANDPALDLLFATVASFSGILLGRLMRLPSPALLGGIAMGLGLSALPVFDDVLVPVWVQAIAILLIGVQIGLKFTRAVLRRLSVMMPTVLIVIVLIIAACAVLGLLLSALTGVTRLDGYLATTPGGLPAVLAATTSTGGDITFVSSVQVLRTIILLVATPVLAQLVLGRRRGPR